MKNIRTLDRYIPRGESAPELLIDNRVVTKRILTALKREKALHLLRYFQIHWDESGREFVVCDIPAGFEGSILNQIIDALDKEG